jgi:hypothetical protein
VAVPLLARTVAPVSGGVFWDVNRGWQFMPAGGNVTAREATKVEIAVFYATHPIVLGAVIGAFMLYRAATRGSKRS